MNVNVKYFNHPEEGAKITDKVCIISSNNQQFPEKIKPIFSRVFTNFLLNYYSGGFTDEVIQKMWNAIYSSKYVVVDCTGEEAYLFYFLGIAHTLGKPVFICTADANVNKIPFDIRHRRVHVYNTDESGIKQLEIELTQFFKRDLNQK